MKKIKSVTELEVLRSKIASSRNPEDQCISICCGTGCRAYGADEVADEFIRVRNKLGLKDKNGVSWVLRERSIGGYTP